ncbi:reverse transcriptase domain-containing protein, partial [Streptomyces sp. DSM 41972]|nr:reverse transcriptase domain-containing protein [Streptomyces sp. DSM 41972]
MHAGFGGRGGETGRCERPVPRSAPTLLKPVSYGFRPLRRAHDAIAEIHFYGTHGYRWVLDADIEACFDSIDHTALMDRVRARVKDKRVLRLVK